MRSPEAAALQIAFYFPAVLSSKPHATFPKTIVQQVQHLGTKGLNLYQGQNFGAQGPNLGTKGPRLGNQGPHLDNQGPLLGNKGQT